jgi:hypothetical protein
MSSTPALEIYGDLEDVSLHISAYPYTAVINYTLDRKKGAFY